MASQRRAGVGSRGRQLVDALTPWLAAAVNLSYALAGAARTGARAVAAGVDRAESLVVPLLVTLARGAALALAVVVHLLADAVDAAARSAADAAHACVEGLAEPLARHGPRLWRAARPGLVRLGVATSRGLVGAVTVVALGLATSGPALQLAARTVRSDLGGEHRGLPPLAEPSVVVAADGAVLAELHDGVDREVVALQRVPPHVRHAVLAAEDRRFYEHRGYDLAAIGRALWANLRARAVRQGASTVTQQLAKQNFVGDAQTLWRKVDELVHAVALEQRFSKDQLLERYLNEVYFGSGAYGIAAAASEYFGVAPERLTVSQGALLAGLVRSPVALDPRRNPPGARARRDEVLDAMAALGLLPAEQAGRLRAEPLQVVAPAPRQSGQPFVVSAVRREFLANPAFGPSQAERVRRLYSGGLRIETTIDPRLQAAAAEAVAAYTRADAGPTAAVAAVEPASGRIRALHSGADFTRVRFDPVTQGRRQPGSIFKPLVAAAALEAGHQPSLPLPGGGPVAVAVAGQADPWVVDNHNGADYGTVDLATALSESVNTAFATLGARLGHERIVDVAGRLGIDVERAFGPPSSRGPAAALGGLTHGVSPLELAGAYATFANSGIHEPPHLIERVIDPDGRPVAQRAPTATRALDPGVNAALVGLLQEVVRGGTGVRARLPGWEPLGKTGTTQDGADGWFVGAVPVLSTAVWLGHPDSRQPVAGLTGAGRPAALWRAFMLRALQGVEPVPFPSAQTDPGAASRRG